MLGFGSDNHSGIHPDLLQAIIDCNFEHAPSYGTDSWSEKANLEMQRLFNQKTQSFFVFNGTAANVLALRAVIRPTQSVFCSDISHLNLDECGAPEFMTGGKLIPLPSQNGKLHLSTLQAAIIRRGDQHYSQTRAVSLTQPTEVGTCYSVEEIRQITAWAHANQLAVHIDGARLANAVVSLNTSFAEMLSETGVDVVSFGGTKNGLMMGEAVVFLNAKYTEDFQYLRKQSCQLPSKTRFIAAQFLTYLHSGLWKKIAEQSLHKAQLLNAQVKDIPQVKIMYPVQSNAVFAQIPQKWVKPLKEKFFFYVWDEKTFECRWMTTFDTTEKQILDFALELKSLSERAPL